MFLFGGVGLGAAISAMQQTCGRPVIWATAQYLSFARPGSFVDIDVWEPSIGNHSTQARVVGHIDDKEIITVNAALGERPSPISANWITPPDVPEPDQCEFREHWRGLDYDMHSRLEMRIAKGRFPGAEPIVGGSSDGRAALWVRAPLLPRVDAPLLAIFADFVSTAISNAIGGHAGGNSLDNTIRFCGMEDTQWVLCDIQIESIQRGVVHGSMHLFSETRQLLAIASQSLILRDHMAG